jgi:hypothetical protein
MDGIIVKSLQVITEPLQYFTGTFVIDKDFAAGGVAKISAVGIGTGWAVGDTAQLTGTANSNIEIVITYIHTDASYILATAVSTAFGADENGSGDEKMNQTAYTYWQDVSGYAVINATIYTATAADAWIQQSWDASNIDASTAKEDIGVATVETLSAAVVCTYARLRLLNEDTDQTTVRATLGVRAHT